jgi:hypothetical protein
VSQLRNQIAGEDAPSVPVAVEYRGHSDARLQEVQAQAQITISSLKVGGWHAAGEAHAFLLQF